jgi:hypothetical protein
MPVALRTFGAAFLAHDMRGLSLQKQLLAFHNRSLICASMVEPFALRGRASLPNSVQGISTHGLLAMLHNGSSLSAAQWQLAQAVPSGAAHEGAGGSLCLLSVVQSMCT